MEKENRIWIELDAPTSAEQAKEQCRLANNMLKRLAEKPEDFRDWFSYSETEKRYRFGGRMGSTLLTDNGTWFNLDYLGRDEEQLEGAR